MAHLPGFLRKWRNPTFVIFPCFSALFALCSLFLRKATFAQPPVFTRVSGREFERNLDLRGRQAQKQRAERREICLS